MIWIGVQIGIQTGKKYKAIQHLEGTMSNIP